ncbi:Acetyltransferase (GNAT) family protein [Agromyces sp. CF514]|uniref:GNAT family N-acetyltransferase n=1 Tax=Agromyces sp. CF514 TaxID=1881031 RepID=UPI0008E13AEF|nr:GNAT family N-acetyltransferase [Agromyces sp. CF514]SFR69995.1 Acetyltransferase (GNAT) family protein [Agromyces sp. CF514]
MRRPHPEIRLAAPGELELLEQLENDADGLFIERFRPTSWRPAPDAATRAAQPGFILVAVVEGSDGDGDRTTVVGFAQVLEHDGHVHLEQLSVSPAHARRGHGRRLVEAAIAHAAALGYAEITLRTYADVPWNGPFYRSCGFVESDPATPWHRELAEHDLGLPGGPASGITSRRIQMTARC